LAINAEFSTATDLRRRIAKLGEVERRAVASWPQGQPSRTRPDLGPRSFSPTRSARSGWAGSATAWMSSGCLLARIVPHHRLRVLRFAGAGV